MYCQILLTCQKQHKNHLFFELGIEGLNSKHGLHYTETGRMLRLNFVYSVTDFDILERKRRCKQLKLHNFSLLMTATLSNISNQERQS